MRPSASHWANWANWKRRFTHTCRAAMRWGQHRLPPGLRSLVGGVLIIAGLFGFLPVLGFWMLPLGAGFIALDIPPVRRRLRHWLD